MEYKKEEWCVYMHISPSFKKYVGITSLKPIKRFGKVGQRYKNNKHFYRAIEKYGWDNFIHIIIEENIDERSAKQLEMFFISNLNLMNKHYGYNKTMGGEGCLGYKMTLEQKNKFKKRWTNDDYRELKIQQSSKKVICLNTNEIYNSAKEASFSVGVHPQNISACCRGESKTSGYNNILHSRLSWKYYDEYIKNQEKF